MILTRKGYADPTISDSDQFSRSSVELNAETEIKIFLLSRLCVFVHCVNVGNHFILFINFSNENVRRNNKRAAVLACFWIFFTHKINILFKETVHMSGKLSACRAHHNGIFKIKISRFHCCCCYSLQRKRTKGPANMEPVNIIMIMMSSIVRANTELLTYETDRDRMNEWKTKRTCSRELSHNKITKDGRSFKWQNSICIECAVFDFVYCYLHISNS